MFGETIDPLDDENWRVLLLDDVAQHIAGTFAAALTEVAANVAVAVAKCIYPRLPIPSKAGGLERLFIRWADQDATVEALVKIHEYRHDFLHRPYLKADGMPAYYSADFILRTADGVYIIETKTQSAPSDENVQRKQKAALP